MNIFCWLQLDFWGRASYTFGEMFFFSLFEITCTDKLGTIRPEACINKVNKFNLDFILPLSMQKPMMFDVIATQPFFKYKWKSSTSSQSRLQAWNKVSREWSQLWKKYRDQN